jgi:hypothetical protein
MSSKCPMMSEGTFREVLLNEELSVDQVGVG